MYQYSDDASSFMVRGCNEKCKIPKALKMKNVQEICKHYFCNKIVQEKHDLLSTNHVFHS